MTVRGLFITFEGGEGVGKTTLMARLFSTLMDRGVSSLRTREPGGCRLGEVVRTWLLKPEHSELVGSQAELLLFLAARAQHLDEVIRPALKRGHVVLCDRFNDSTVAYQGYARGLGAIRVSQLCDLVCEGVVPDLTLLLDLEPVTGLARAGNRQSRDAMEALELEFHTRVREGFLKVAEEQRDRVAILDASRSAREVYSQALPLLERLLLERKWS